MNDNDWKQAFVLFVFMTILGPCISHGLSQLHAGGFVLIPLLGLTAAYLFFVLMTFFMTGTITVSFFVASIQTYCLGNAAGLVLSSNDPRAYVAGLVTLFLISVVIRYYYVNKTA